MKFLYIISIIFLFIIVQTSSYILYNICKRSPISTILFSSVDASSEFALTPALNKYVTGISN